jgi:hypothetical protein
MFLHIFIAVISYSSKKWLVSLVEIIEFKMETGGYCRVLVIFDAASIKYMKACLKGPLNGDRKIGLLVQVFF